MTPLHHTAHKSAKVTARHIRRCIRRKWHMTPALQGKIRSLCILPLPRIARALDAEHNNLNKPHSRLVRRRVEVTYRTGLENTRPLPPAISTGCDCGHWMLSIVTSTSRIQDLCANVLRISIGQDWRTHGPFLQPYPPAVTELLDIDSHPRDTAMVPTC